MHPKKMNMLIILNMPKKGSFEKKITWCKQPLRRGPHTNGYQLVEGCHLLQMLNMYDLNEGILIWVQGFWNPNFNKYINYVPTNSNFALWGGL